VWIFVTLIYAHADTGREVKNNELVNFFKSTQPSASVCWLLMDATVCASPFNEKKCSKRKNSFLIVRQVLVGMQLNTVSADSKQLRGRRNDYLE